jgi:hypothetical protein
VQNVNWLASDMLLADVRKYMKPEDVAQFERSEHREPSA